MGKSSLLAVVAGTDGSVQHDHSTELDAEHEHEHASLANVPAVAGAGAVAGGDNAERHPCGEQWLEEEEVNVVAAPPWRFCTCCSPKNPWSFRTERNSAATTTSWL